MKNLKIDEKYYIGSLSPKQMETLCDWLKANCRGWQLSMLILNRKNYILEYDGDEWCFDNIEDNYYVNALSLFTPSKLD